MALAGAFNALKSSTLISWKTTGKFQQTIANCIERTGKTLHSGKVTTVKIWPDFAGEGRYFDFNSKFIRASIDFAEETPLCTTLCRDGHSVRTVEHLLSALEATGVDNCRIEINASGCEDRSVEVPIFDGSAREWVEAIEQAGLKVATDRGGNSCKKMAPFLNEPVNVWRKDSFITAFPSPEVRITCGINFPQVHYLLHWCLPLAASCSLQSHLMTLLMQQISSSRTFCIYEEVERMRSAGLVKGGSLENAIVCSTSRGWLNPPLRFHDEPCRHKVLDLIGDFSLFAKCGSQGLPVAHIVAYKGGHALHGDFVRCLSGIN